MRLETNNDIKVNKIKRLEKNQSFFEDSFMAIALTIFFVIISQISVLLLPNGNENILIFSISQFLFLFLPSYAIINYLQFSGKIKKLNIIKLNKFHFIVFFIAIILTQLTGYLFVYILENTLPIDILEVIEKMYDEIDQAQKKLLSFEFNNPMLVIFAISITPAIFEEFLFRGYLQTILKENFSTNIAILITSLIFTIIHLNFVSFFGIFLLSCVIGFYKEKTNSLKIPILIHFLNNFISIMLYNGFTFFDLEI